MIRYANERVILPADQPESTSRSAPISSVIQDFRQVVQFALSTLRVTERSLRRDSQELGAKMVGEAVAALDRSLHLAHRLAASASLSHGCDQIVSVQSLILSVGDLLREAFGDSVSLQTCVAEGTPPVRCDPATLENVLLNLAISVRNSMPEGGLLLIESRGRGSTGAVNRGDFGELVSITVTSAHQPSVSRERAAQAARPLFEGSGRRTGTPIALTNVRRFAGAMGGSAESETLDGGGTSVRLLLPAFRGNFER